MDPRTLVRALALVAAAGGLASAEVGHLHTGPMVEGRMVARQVVPATRGHGLASSRTLYLARGGVDLQPGPNDARARTSTLVRAPVHVPAWATTPEIWSDTVACVREIYAPFAVTVTDVDPGETPHIMAVFGGSPLTLGLPRTIAGISPFTEDCGVIEHAIVFTFTEVLPGDARTACHIAAQEIAHSFGLDHELLATDPMTALHAPGVRAFADQEVACGETTPRPCGLGGSRCRNRQNSFALLAARAGLAGISPAPSQEPMPDDDDEVGCAATRSSSGNGLLAGALAVLALITRRRAS